MQELLKHFHELSLHPKNGKELKGLILQLAIQGKLTADWRAQNSLLISGENSADNLLKEIKAEKTKLIKEKKIKKEKALSPIAYDEVPYELPEGWAWCRLMEVTEYIQRGKSPKYSEVPKIPVVSQKCVQWSGFDISKARFITEESLEKYQDERFLIEGDLLWNSTGNGTIGRTILFPDVEYNQIVADSHVTVVRPYKKSLLPEYLWFYSASPQIQKTIEGRVSGSTKQTELGTGTVKALEFALPPVEEQKAIVKIVETLFNEVEALEKLTEKRIELKKDYATSALSQLAKNDSKVEWKALKPQFHTFFNEVDNIKKLKETILQLAVQGKLTSKWRAENPELISGKNSAENLLEEIKAKKAKLVKEKKIKKEKALPPITEEEIPFELPEGWVWCRLGDILRISSGNGLTRNKMDLKGKIPVYGGNGINGYHSTSNVKERTLVIGRVGYYCGSVHLTDSEAWITDNAFITKFPEDKISMDFLALLLNATDLKRNQNATAQPVISGRKVYPIVVAIPPLKEQYEVYQFKKTLMSLCDQLEQEIENGIEQIEDLMQSVLKEVFEGEKELNEVSII